MLIWGSLELWLELGDYVLNWGRFLSLFLLFSLARCASVTAFHRELSGTEGRMMSKWPQGNVFGDKCCTEHSEVVLVDGFG